MKNLTRLKAFALTVSCVSIYTVPAIAQTHQASSVASQEHAAEGYIDADPKAVIEMLKLPMDEEIHLLNMMRFRDKAQYPEGSEFANKGWTGAQAVAEFRRNAASIVEKVGGHTHYTGVPQLTLIGPDGEQWDTIFIISYPNMKAFQTLLEDPDYKKHFFHRKAGTADSRLIRMVPATSPD